MEAQYLMRIAAAAVVAYVVGSIPFSVIWGRRFFGTDVRAHGSGNAGATNVLRTLGWKAALPVALLDIAKGSLAVFLGMWIVGGSAPELVVQVVKVVASVSAVLGHSYSPFLKFAGGKGVATMAGALIVVTPLVLVPAVGVWLIVTLATRYVSLGSVLAAVSYPVWVWVFYAEDGVLIVFALLVAALVVFRHRSNIARLMAGTERKVSVGRPVPPSEKER